MDFIPYRVRYRVHDIKTDCMYTNTQKTGKKGRFFITVGFRLINVDRMMEYKNHHLVITTVITVSGKSFLVSKSVR